MLFGSTKKRGMNTMALFKKKKGSLATRKLNDEPLAGATLQPPFMLLLFGLLEMLWGLVCIRTQIDTSNAAFYKGIHDSAVVGSSPATLHLMALTIAVSVEIIVLYLAWPISVIWHQLEHGHFYTTPGQHKSVFSAAKEVSKHLTMRQLLGIVAFVGNVLGDIRFANITTHDFVSVFLYALFLTACSTLVTLDGAQRFWGGIKAWKEFRHEFRARTGGATKPRSGP
jgi:hypothetical protein